MKISILTFSHNINFGATLQCYALSKVLMDKGHDVSILYIPLHGYGANEVKLSIVTRIVNKVKRGCLKIARLVSSPENERYTRTKAEQEADIRVLDKVQKLNDEFYENYMPTTVGPFYTEAELRDQATGLDYYIVGSDQVWNPIITGDQAPLYFFSFLKDEPRMSYAASTCKVENWNLPNEETDRIKSLLDKFNSISVREEEGQKLLKQVLDKDSKLVLDPTLLLDASLYEKLALNSTLDAANQLYSFKFIINDKWLETIKYVANELELSPRFDGERMPLKGVDYNPVIKVEDWLKLIQSSEFVFTDSFHGTVFCIIFRKQFCVTPSYKGGEDRMIQLLKICGLENRYCKTTSEVKSKIQELRVKIDYDKVYEKLNLERKKSLDYLFSEIDRVNE